MNSKRLGVSVYFKVQSRHSPPHTEEKHENISEQLVTLPTFEPGTSKIQANLLSDL